MKYAVVFSMLGATCFFYALNVQNVGAKIVLLSCALCWNGVGAAYAFNQPRVFGKRDDDQLAVWSWFVFWPCHFLNAMTMRFFRMTNREPWTKSTTRFFSVVVCETATIHEATIICKSTAFSI